MYFKFLVALRSLAPLNFTNFKSKKWSVHSSVYCMEWCSLEDGRMEGVFLTLYSHPSLYTINLDRKKYSD